MKTQSVGTVARAAGVGVETIRYYERVGLLDEPSRKASGYRAYDNGAVERLRFIRRAKALGFTLREIKELIALDARAPGCEDVRERAETKIKDVRAKIDELSRIETALREIVATCGENDGCGLSCSVVRCL